MQSEWIFAGRRTRTEYWADMTHAYFPRVLCAGAFFIATISGAPLLAQSSPPQPTNYPGDWITQADYPKEALDKWVTGSVGFELDIDKSGRITGCRIRESPGTEKLDKIICKIIPDQAKFEPARDEAGLPVAGTYTNRVRFEMPQKDLKEPTNFSVTYALVIGIDGQSQDCQVGVDGTGAYPFNSETKRKIIENFEQKLTFTEGGARIPFKVSLKTETLIEPADESDLD